MQWPVCQSHRQASGSGLSPFAVWRGSTCARSCSARSSDSRARRHISASLRASQEAARPHRLWQRSCKDETFAVAAMSRYKRPSKSRRGAILVCVTLVMCATGLQPFSTEQKTSIGYYPLAHSQALKHGILAIDLRTNLHGPHRVNI